MSNAIDSPRERRYLVAVLCTLAAIVLIGQPVASLGARSVGDVAGATVVSAQAGRSTPHPPRGGKVTVRRVRRHPTKATTATTVTTTVAPVTTTVSTTVAPTVTPTSPPARPPSRTAITPGATGSFEFNSYAPLSDRPLKVWYFAPAGDLTAVKVIIVMHGQSRNAEGYRDSWIAEARSAGALLVVPEFSDALYPGSDAYNLGNVGLEPVSRWSFSVIEPLFDYVRAQTGNHTDRYLLYGHSAGAQFVHRFMLLVPNNRVERAVIANAGWYTAPEPNIAFPYGLRGSPVTDAGLRRAFATRLTVLLGEDDTDPNDPDLRHTTEADRQGLSRLARGRFFYQAGLTTSTALGTPFGWTLQTVPGVAHTNGGMVPAAARILCG